MKLEHKSKNIKRTDLAERPRVTLPSLKYEAGKFDDSDPIQSRNHYNEHEVNERVVSSNDGPALKSEAIVLKQRFHTHHMRPKCGVHRSPDGQIVLRCKIRAITHARAVVTSGMIIKTPIAGTSSNASWKNTRGMT